jgi:choice-of-anchor B domain-containing protein
MTLLSPSVRKILLLGLLVIVAAGSSPALAQWVPVASQRGFGQVLEADDAHFFVADPSPRNAYTPGQVHVYERAKDGSWNENTVLEPEDGEVGDDFGSALAAENGTLVVGYPSDNAAYIFRNDGTDWTRVARIAPTDRASGFGVSVALVRERIFVSATKTDSAGTDGSSITPNRPSPNAVYVFERTNSGDWQQEAFLQSEGLGPDARFGATLLASDERVLVGAPQHQSGVVAAFRRRSGQWAQTQTVSVDDLSDGARFGAALQSANDRIFIGAPGASGAVGNVYGLSRKDQTWTVRNRLSPSQDTSEEAFGSALVYDDGELWVGTPNATNRTGVVYQFERGGNGWTRGRRLASPVPNEGMDFGTTLAKSGSTVAVGLPGDDHGEGTMALYSTSEEKWTANSPIVPSQTNAFTAVTGEDNACSDGNIGRFPCQNVDLKAFLPVSAIGGERGIELNDIWGWTDPKTGTEYALVGRADGTAFVNVSDPNNPVYVGELPKTEGSRVNSWRDIKVYEDHAYVVADNVGDHGMQVFDLTRLRDVAPEEAPVTFGMDAHYDRINSSHNIVINSETGYAYAVGNSAGGETCGGGLHMINIQNPQDPTFAGCLSGQSTGQGGTGGTHDAQCIRYDGPDQEHRGREICVNFNATAISVVDVTNKENPKVLSTTSYPDYGYVHQGWFTGDRRYMYSNDEADEIQGKVDRTRTLVWDMTDLDNPTLVNQLSLSTEASDHNLYVKGDRMYQSNYKSGFRVLDISNPENPEEIGHFDLYPPSSTPGFKGTWSNYPYFESGIIVTSTYDGGFFVLEPSTPEL